MLALLLMLPAAALFESPPLEDADLAGARGGFRLPSGIDVALSVRTETAVDGRLVLASTFSVIDNATSFSVATPKDGTVLATAPTRAVTTARAPQLDYDMRGGFRITPSASVPVVVMAGGKSALAQLDASLDTIPAGGSLRTAAGVASNTTAGALNAARLDANDLTVVHFAGSAFGSAIVNMGSDRTIDTSTTLAIDLTNAGPDVLGSAMFRAEGVALDAMRLRGGL